MDVRVPENMTFLVTHKTYHAKPPDNSSMSTFVCNKDTVIRGYLFCYAEQMNQIESISCIKINVYTTMIKVRLCDCRQDIAAIRYSYRILVGE